MRMGVRQRARQVVHGGQKRPSAPMQFGELFPLWLLLLSSIPVL